MKLADVEADTYIDFEVDKENKDLEFKVGYHVRISTFNNIFAKRYAISWSVKFIR